MSAKKLRKHPRPNPQERREVWADDSGPALERSTARLAELRRRAAKGQAGGVEAFAESVEELGIALEELHTQSADLEASVVLLRKERARYRELFEFAPGGYYITDLAGVLRDLNRSGLELVGKHKKRSELLGSPIVKLFARADRAAIEAVIVDLGTGTSRQQSASDLRLSRRGKQRYVNVVAERAETREGERSIRWLLQDVSERIEAQRVVHRLAAGLQVAQDEERRRVARELHDATGQNLAAILLNVAAVRRSGDLGEEALRRLDDAEQLLDECTREVRTLSYVLHPPFLDDEGLGSALRWLADGFSRRSGIAVVLELEPRQDEPMPLAARQTMFRIAQECLTNVLHHSGASEARIELRLSRTTVTLEVSDNGAGISPDRLRAVREGLGGLGIGIAGMRERLRQLGGRLEVRSDVGVGTTFSARISSRGFERMHEDEANSDR